MRRLMSVSILALSLAMANPAGAQEWFRLNMSPTIFFGTDQGETPDGGVNSNIAINIDGEVNGRVYPMVTSLGFDGIWFGVIMVKLVELAVLTPPVGMNLFAVIGASEGRVTLAQIYRGITPFIVIEAIILALLIGFPQISLWLPNQMFSH